EGKACVGMTWSTAVFCFTDGAWRKSAEVMSAFGGSAVGAVAFDDSGTMLAVGAQSITVAGDDVTDLGPFDPTPFGKNHLFGAVVSAKPIAGADAVASGGWGGTVFLKRNGKKFSDTGRGGPDMRAQPSILRKMASHPKLGLLAAGDGGLFRWEGTPAEGGWRSLRDIDPRLSVPLTGVVASTGRGFWIAAGNRV